MIRYDISFTKKSNIEWYDLMRGWFTRSIPNSFINYSFGIIWL